MGGVASSAEDPSIPISAETAFTVHRASNARSSHMASVIGSGFPHHSRGASTVHHRHGSDWLDAVALEPRIDLRRIEAYEATNLDEGDSALVDEPSDELVAHAQALGQRGYIDQCR